MLTLYRPGNGWLHRMAAGPKTLLLLVLCLAVSLLPSAWWAAAAASTLVLSLYATAGLGHGMAGIRELGRQLYGLRWAILLTALSQLIFLGVEPAVTNAVRVVAAVVLAALLVLTTRATALLSAVESALRPLEKLRLDSQRAALLLTVTFSTIPILVRAAKDVRDAQRARGARGGLRTFLVPFLVMVLKHADELGDALTARGVR